MCRTWASVVCLAPRPKAECCHSSETHSRQIQAGRQAARSFPDTTHSWPFATNEAEARLIPETCSWSMNPAPLADPSANNRCHVHHRCGSGLRSHAAGSSSGGTLRLRKSSRARESLAAARNRNRSASAAPAKHGGAIAQQLDVLSRAGIRGNLRQFRVIFQVGKVDHAVELEFWLAS